MGLQEGASLLVEECEGSLLLHVLVVIVHLALLGLLSLLVQTWDVGHNSALSEVPMTKQLVQLWVVPDGEHRVPGLDGLLLSFLGLVTR